MWRRLSLFCRMYMKLTPRFSLFTFLVLVGLLAVGLVCIQRWLPAYHDWRAAEAVRERAAKLFKEETGSSAPAEIVHILGSGKLSHWSRVTDIGMTADHIISCGRDYSVRCWSVSSGEPLQMIAGVEARLALDSQLLVTVDIETRRNVCLYDTSSLPLKVNHKIRLKESEAAASLLFTSPLSDKLLLRTAAGRVAVFDLTTGERLCYLDSLLSYRRHTFGLNSDNRLLVATEDQAILFQLPSGDVETTWNSADWPFVKQSVKDVVPLSPQQWLIVGASSNVIWNSKSGESQYVDLRTSGTPQLIVPSQRQVWIANRGTMSRLRIFGAEAVLDPIPTAPIASISSMAIYKPPGPYASDGYRAVGHSYGRVSLLAPDGNIVLPQREADQVVSIAFSSDGSHLAYATSNNEIVILHTGTWTVAERFSVYDIPPKQIAFSNGDNLLLVTDDQSLAFIDWKGGEVVWQRLIRFMGAIEQVAIVGEKVLYWDGVDGWTLMDLTSKASIATSGREVSPPHYSGHTNWSAADRSFVVPTREGLSRIEVVAMQAGEGARLKVSTDNNIVTKWMLDIDYENKRTIRRERDSVKQKAVIEDLEGRLVSESLFPRRTSISYADFSPDAKHLALINENDVVVCDVATGAELYRQRIGPSNAQIRDIDYSPDGRYLAILNGNGTCYLLRNPL